MWHYPPDLLWNYLLESLVCLIHTPPYLPISDSYGLFMLLRGYLVFRLIRDNNYIFNNQDAYKASDPNEVTLLHTILVAEWLSGWVAGWLSAQWLSD